MAIILTYSEKATQTATYKDRSAQTADNSGIVSAVHAPAASQPSLRSNVAQAKRTREGDISMAPPTKTMRANEDGKKLYVQEFTLVSGTFLWAVDEKLRDMLADLSAVDIVVSRDIQGAPEGMIIWRIIDPWVCTGVAHDRVCRRARPIISPPIPLPQSGEIDRGCFPKYKAWSRVRAMEWLISATFDPMRKENADFRTWLHHLGSEWLDVYVRDQVRHKYLAVEKSVEYEEFLRLPETQRRTMRFSTPPRFKERDISGDAVKLFDLTGWDTWPKEMDGLEVEMTARERWRRSLHLDGDFAPRNDEDYYEAV